MYHFTSYYLTKILWDEGKKRKEIGKTYRPKQSASYIGHRLPRFLNIGIGQRKTHIGRPLVHNDNITMIDLERVYLSRLY